MPNWCVNKVTLSGHEVCTEIFDYISNEQGYFLSKYVPSEDNNTVWGTKWDVRCEDIIASDNNGTVYLEFHTAWCPPIVFFESLVNKYKGLKVELQYAEPGMCFIGEWTSNNHDENDCYEWYMDDTSVPAPLKEAFAEFYETN